jgi:hypothetical protein
MISGYNNHPEYFLARHVITADGTNHWFPPELGPLIDGETMELHWKGVMFASVTNVATSRIKKIQRPSNGHIWSALNDQYDAMEALIPLGPAE